MNTKKIADLLGVVPNTLRRWCADFETFLSPTANPPKGKVRIFTPHDLRILHYIAVARLQNQSIEGIAASLQDMHNNDWLNLPDVPPEWLQPEEQMPVTVAASKAYDIAQIAVLQRELEFAERRYQEAQARVELLESELETARTNESEHMDKIHALELELSNARGEVSELSARLSGEVAELKARLSSYAITGGDRPIPVALIIIAALVAGALLVALSLILARLLL